jgi:hypothetical protein
MNIGKEKPRSGDRTRQDGRGGFFHRFKRSSLVTLLADRWFRFGNWLFNWWHPPSGSAYPGYGSYGGSRRNRLSRTWRHLGQRIRGSEDHGLAACSATCFSVCISGGTRLPAVRIPVMGITAAPGVTACPGLGGIWRNGLEDHGSAAFSARYSSVCMSGGIRPPKKRIQVTPPTAALAEADLS